MELSPLEESPSFISGVVNLRGKIIPVVDLQARFGREPEKYHLTDCVVILTTDVMPIGIVVNDVHDVIRIPAEHVEPSPLSLVGVPIPPRFVKKVARVGEHVIMILNHADLLSTPELQTTAFAGRDAKTESLVRPLFCPEASPEERAIFRERARLLREAPADEDFAGLPLLAVVGLNDEYFGVDVQLVREFAEITNPTPIPCCPGHVVGNMNLRGNILTLVDIRPLLDMPTEKAIMNGKVVVAVLDDLCVGLVVEDVFDLVYLSSSEIRPTPPAVEKEYLEGTAEYAGKMMTILNLTAVLQSEELFVAEEV